jgi:hypothetical protein
MWSVERGENRKVRGVTQKYHSKKAYQQYCTYCNIRIRY